MYCTTTYDIEQIFFFLVSLGLGSVPCCDLSGGRQGVPKPLISALSGVRLKYSNSSSSVLKIFSVPSRLYLLLSLSTISLMCTGVSVPWWNTIADTT